MGKDVKWCDYFKDNRRYADIINGVLCKGQQVVSQEDLTELDTRSKEKTRDLVCKVAVGVNFAIIGIENQDEIDYELPVRIMEYDVSHYRQQIAGISKNIRANSKELRPGEYMYGFKKESRLHPVTTIVLYAGSEPWDGPESLHEMVDFTKIPNSIKELVQDYRINVVDIRRLTDTSIFKTDVAKVFDFIRFSEKWDELYRLVNNDSYYQNMDEDAYEVVAKYANIKKEGNVKINEYKGKDGKVNVCKGIQDLMDYSKAEGREEGRSLGVEQERRNIITNMLKRNKSIEEICDIVECDVAYVQKIIQTI